MNTISTTTRAVHAAQPQLPGMSKDLTAALIGLSQQKAATQLASAGLNAATANISQAVGNLVDVRV